MLPLERAETGQRVTDLSSRVPQVTGGRGL